MRNAPTTLGGIALTLLLATTSELHADLITWSYAWSRSPAEVYSDNGNAKVSIYTVPEPSALVLSSLGLTVWGVLGRRKRRPPRSHWPETLPPDFQGDCPF